VSQDSNDQNSIHDNVKENENEEDCMEIFNLEASGTENQQFKGQFQIWFTAKFSNSENFPHSKITVCIGIDFGYDTNGKRYKTSEGLTKRTHYNATRRNKMVTAVLNSQVCYLKFTWAKFNSNKYTKAID